MRESEDGRGSPTPMIFVLYLGWTLDFMRGSWPIEPSDSQGQPIRAILLNHSCTNAAPQSVFPGRIPNVISAARKGLGP